MSDGSAERCPGCGLREPAHGRDGPTHPYLLAAPGCWALYTEVLAREYGDPARLAELQLTVDAYAVQHPGAPERRSAQSVALHLVTLCLVVERGADPGSGPRVHRRLTRGPGFHWLEPPRPNGHLTVASVHGAPSAAEHRRRVRAWAADVWRAWAEHHDAVHGWIARDLAGWS